MKNALTCAWQVATIALLCIAMAVAPACSLATDLQKADQIIALLPAGIDLVPPIVCAIDVAACPGVSAAAKIADAGVGALSSALSAWASASGSAQPDAWSQVQAALTALQGQTTQLIAAAQVKNPAFSSEVQAIAGAVIAEIGEIGQIVSQIKGAGGTTASLAGVLDTVAMVDDADLGTQCHGDCQAIWTPTVSVGLRRETHKTKAGMKVHTRRGFKNSLLKHLGKTGNPELDRLNAVLAKRLKSF